MRSNGIDRRERERGREGEREGERDGEGRMEGGRRERGRERGMEKGGWREEGGIREGCVVMLVLLHTYIHASICVFTKYNSTLSLCPHNCSCTPVL